MHSVADNTDESACKSECTNDSPCTHEQCCVAKKCTHTGSTPRHGIPNASHPAVMNEGEKRSQECELGYTASGDATCTNGVFIPATCDANPSCADTHGWHTGDTEIHGLWERRCALSGGSVKPSRHFKCKAARCTVVDCCDMGEHAPVMRKTSRAAPSDNTMVFWAQVHAVSPVMLAL